MTGKKPSEPPGLTIAQACAAAKQIDGKTVLLEKGTAVRFRVIEERIDLDALRQEAEALRQALEQPRECDAELLERARSMQQSERQAMQERLAQLVREMAN